MSISLAEALESVDLEPGQVYRELIHGLDVELRVLPRKPATTDESPSPELMNQIMLEPWCEFPRGPLQQVVGRFAPLSMPDPPIIPEDFHQES